MEHVKGASAEVLGGAFGAVRGALRGRQTGQTGQTALELRPLSTVASFPGAVVGSYGVSNRAAFESSQIQAFLCVMPRDRSQHRPRLGLPPPSHWTAEMELPGSQARVEVLLYSVP